MPADQQLLLIKDDTCSIRSIAEALRNQGYTVVMVSKFEFIADPGLADHFDLIVIDHSEPRLNAMEICVELRLRHIEAPILVLAARNHTDHRIAIFKAGADDYVAKPVDMVELQLRIEALLIRFSRMKQQEIMSYEFGERLVDFRRSCVIRNGTAVALSEREAKLLRFFVQNRGKTISRSALLQHVWGYRHSPLTRTVDVHILRLRHKIEDNPKDPQFIITVPGFGYRFDG
jgi:two-component system, OmpR family, alkaline phosphatase synthesis response regulator PhoP